jgi:hypothetical protein
MRRIGLLVGVALTAAALVAGPVSAAKPPTLTTVLVHDGGCGFTPTASWTGVKVGSVAGMWKFDNQILHVSFADVGKARSVTLSSAPATATTGSHTWSVITQFYSGPGLSGVLVGQAESNVITANCALQIIPM